MDDERFAAVLDAHMRNRGVVVDRFANVRVLCGGMEPAMAGRLEHFHETDSALIKRQWYRLEQRSKLSRRRRSVIFSVRAQYPISVRGLGHQKDITTAEFARLLLPVRVVVGLSLFLLGTAAIVQGAWVEHVVQSLDGVALALLFFTSGLAFIWLPSGISSTEYVLVCTTRHCSRVMHECVLVSGYTRRDELYDALGPLA